ncbi:MAG TPA: TIGR02996 domain-containing protein [Kofleriaceae bacterium]
MQCRRLEHDEKRRFVEIFWEDGAVEITSGAFGSNGRTRDFNLGPAAAEAFVAAEVAKRLREGFVEVVPEAQRAQRVRHAALDAEWIARIAAAYDDDVPRVVYADHLQSLGDPLGELIVVQCELARIDRWEPRAGELREREDTLLRTYRQRWLPGIEPEIRCTFRRGFVERVAIAHSVQRATIELVMRYAPLIRTLEVEVAPPYSTAALPWEIARPLLPQLTGLAIEHWHGGIDQLRALFEDADLRCVERLSLPLCSITASNLGPIARRAWRELDLCGNVLGLRGMKLVLADPSRLEALDLSACGIGNAGVVAIADASLVRLRRLTLESELLQPAPLRRLARSPNLAALESLDVSRNRNVSALFDEPALPALRELDVSETDLDDDGLAALLASPLAAQLRVLDASHTRITDARLFLEVELPQLRVLDISRNALRRQVRELKTNLPHVAISARSAK